MTTNSPEEAAGAAVPAARPRYMGKVDLTNEQYHAADGISKSHLDCIASKSLMHYWHQYLNPEREAEVVTPAKVLGTAIHSIILEPDLFATSHVANPGIDRRSNAGKAEYAAFLEESKGKAILTDEQYQHCLQVRDAFYRHPLAPKLLTGGKPEQTFFAIDPETGELIKCRYDYLDDGGAMAVDLKSTDDASPVGFGKSVANYRYDLQPPWYFDVLDILYDETPRHWAFIALEKEPPYAIGIYFLTPAQMHVGRATARRDFMRIVNAKKAGAWPDYGSEILPVEMPGWVKRTTE